ncbi:hypothetical protein JKP88DRAFT_255426 [Tribonema minus]|uniref:Uncharacterized protein n=1 Tax=Tribonema minus TaxID=303371 RepID=A0A835YZX7_9STRA|nr:hypothetical protein JKP88DRAFT_255426 [Tribonema minus]
MSDQDQDDEDAVPEASKQAAAAAVAPDVGALQAELVDSRARQAELEYRLQLSEGLVKEWQARAERALNNAKYDQMAREAHARKLILAEHEVGGAKAEIEELRTRITALQSEARALQRAWQDERAQRLQDLHRHAALSAEAERLRGAARDAEARAAAADALTADAQSNRARAAEARVTAMQARELADQSRDLEELQLKLVRLRQCLAESESGGGGDRQRARQQICGSAGAAAARSPCCGGGGGGSSGEAGGLRHDSPWRTPWSCGTGARDVRSSGGGGGGKGGGGSCGEWPLQESSLVRAVGSCRSASPPLRARGPLAMLVASPRHRQKQQRSTDARGSSLAVPGSLFVSSGLGVRKSEVLVGRGSAKEALLATLSKLR